MALILMSSERNQMNQLEVDYEWVAKVLYDLEIELINRRERARLAKYMLAFAGLALVGVWV